MLWPAPRKPHVAPSRRCSTSRRSRIAHGIRRLRRRSHSSGGGPRSARLYRRVGRAPQSRLPIALPQKSLPPR
jgi:hypothetical protein